MLGNMYFPMSHYPEVFLLFKVMTTTSSARTLIKNLLTLASDLETWVKTRINEHTDESIFYPIFGMF